jgi:hypothetical protein
LPHRFRDHRRFSAMPTLSHVHQLFSVETCHAYIHAPAHGCRKSTIVQPTIAESTSSLQITSSIYFLPSL